ncbi:MAG: ATP-dependent helicase [Polyangiales bacterium]
MMQLNCAQQRAVDHAEGPLLVLAGAGSGKTRVITQRIAALLERGVRPEAILAVSFTNKAAAELGQRLTRTLGGETCRRLWLSTFHRFGVRFLQEEAKHIWGDARFVIFDQGDSLGLIREILRQVRAGDKALDAQAIQARISLWKNRFWSPERVPESDFEYDAVARAVYAQYESALQGMRAADFDDLIIAPARLLEHSAEVRARWQARFFHLLIDEFQDTNHAQLRLTRLLTNSLGNICVVGDDDQAIYSWRGAEVRNILEFDRVFPGAEIVKLEDNYRSKAPILQVANAVIAPHKEEKHRKILRPVRGDGAPVNLLISADLEAEAKAVVREIRLLRGEGHALGDMAVLYRSNLQARVIEAELRVEGIAYQMLGGTQYFDRKEVKDAIAYLRVLANPDDELSLRRALHFPSRGFGPAALAQLQRFALMEGIGLLSALGRAEEMEALSRPVRTAALRLHAAFVEASTRLQRGHALVDVARQLFSATGVDAALQEQGKGRMDNLAYLLRSLERCEGMLMEQAHLDAGAEGVKPAAISAKAAKLHQFLHRLTLRFGDETSDEQKRQQVTLSTLHAAKGLEFGVVFLIGCVEGQLPHSRSTDPKISDAFVPDVDEERRLFYVGVTRAKDRLFLSRARCRKHRGSTQLLAPSRFLTGLPEDAVQEGPSAPAKALDHDEIAAFSSALLRQLEG